jgi:hypothetical protein
MQVGDGGGDDHHLDDRPQLLLGPLLRYVDERRATLWFETSQPCEVVVLAGGVLAATPTWSVHGHHYALVRLDDLPERAATPYQVTLDGHPVWPLPDSPFPPSVIRTPDPDAPYRLSFGSCRRSAPFDAAHLEELGADALAALAARMADEPHDTWPDLLLLLGDQVYADEPSDEILERLRAAHHGRDPEIADEIQNFEEYTWLYHEAWTPPAVRWLLSTVPSGMLLDDHDLRDDWNTSLSWRQEVTATSWWRDRVTGAYASYWIHQHLGNLSPEQLDADETYARMRDLTDDAERTRYLDEMAWRADCDPTSIRWSFCRDLGGAGHRVRLVAVDGRCSRQLDPDDRRMVDAVEWAWVREQVLDPDHPYDHLVLASTLPFLLPPGIHHLEGWNEAISEGAWGRPGAWVGEHLRQLLDLEHWAAWRASFAELTDLLAAVVQRPEPPATILLLGGDVHASYTATAELADVEHPATAIHQLTMSPFRNVIERPAKLAFRLLNRKAAAAAAHRLARWSRVDDVAMHWVVEHGIRFENGLMTIDLAGRRASLAVDRATHADGDQHLERTLDVELGPGTPSPDADVDDATATV